MAGDGITVTGRDFARDLERAADKIPAVLNEAIRNESPGIQRAGEVRALTVNLRGGKRGTPDSGLKRALASAIGTEYENEKVTFVVSRTAMPNGKQAMPLVSVTRQWRHPVFGNRNVWVTQTGETMWFSRSLRNEAMRVLPPEIERLLEGLIPS